MPRRSTTSVPPHSNEASGRAVRRSNARDPPARGDRRERKTLRRLQERRSRGGPLLRHPLQSTLRRAHDGDLALETFREVEDDVDAATPVDAQNAPTWVWNISHRTRDSHSAHIDHCSLTKRKNEEQNHSDQLSTESDHPHSRLAGSKCPSGH